MHALSRQKGATLFMTLIMLVVLTLFVVSAITMSTSNLRVVNNVQAQNEAEAAGQQAIAWFISQQANFEFAPTTNTIKNIDINGDGVTDYVVTLKPPALLGSSPTSACSFSLRFGCNKNTWWEVTACVKADTSNNLPGFTTNIVAVHEGVRVPLPLVTVLPTTPPQSCP